MDREIITSNDRAALRRELQLVILVEPDLGDLIKRVGLPEPRIRLPDFETLLQIIVSQQLSTHVSAVISGRLKKLCGGRVTWRKILNRSDEQLRQCGLSWRKVEYARNLAEMIRLKKLDLNLLIRMDAETVVRQLVEIRGFGRWSGEIFAMFALGHKDIFPADDLALQIAIQRYLGLRNKPDGKQVAEIAKRWSPHRSAVALLMWKFYGSTTMD